MSEDLDPLETQEWRDALDSVVEFDGADRAASCSASSSKRRAGAGCAGALLGEHALPQHHPARAGAAAPG